MGYIPGCMRWMQRFSKPIAEIGVGLVVRMKENIIDLPTICRQLDQEIT